MRVALVGLLYLPVEVKCTCIKLSPYIPLLFRTDSFYIYVIYHSRVANPLVHNFRSSRISNGDVGAMWTTWYIFSDILIVDY